MGISVFQQFGFLTSEARNIRDETLASFVDAGGKWIAVLVDQLGRPNGEGVQWNRDHFDDIRLRFSKAAVEHTGVWFNGWARDPTVDAADVVDFVHKKNAGPVVLDLEGDYKGANAWKMPELLAQIRTGLPTRSISVTTPGLFDNAMIWNGRTLTPKRSFFDLGVRWLPQWYSAYYSKDGHTDPVFCLSELKAKGASDGNFQDATAPSGRGLPLSFVKGMVEVSGLENSSLADELGRLEVARQQNLIRAKGISGYLLENTPDTDWALFRSVRGVLY